MQGGMAEASKERESCRRSDICLRKIAAFAMTTLINPQQAQYWAGKWDGGKTLMFTIDMLKCDCCLILCPDLKNVNCEPVNCPQRQQ